MVKSTPKAKKMAHSKSQSQNLIYFLKNCGSRKNREFFWERFFKYKAFRDEEAKREV
jgi:hypothetical protein